MTQDGRWQDALARYVAMAADSKHPEQRVQANLAASDLMIQLGRTQESLELLESQLEQLDPDSWLYREVRRRIEAIFRGRKDDLPGLVGYYESWINTSLKTLMRWLDWAIPCRFRIAPPMRLRGIAGRSNWPHQMSHFVNP